MTNINSSIKLLQGPVPEPWVEMLLSSVGRWSGVFGGKLRWSVASLPQVYYIYIERSHQHYGCALKYLLGPLILLSRSTAVIEV